MTLSSLPSGHLLNSTHHTYIVQFANMETRRRTTSEKLLDNELYDVSAKLNDLLRHDPNSVPISDLKTFAAELKHVSAEFMKKSLSKSSQLLKHANTHEAHEESSRRHDMREEITQAVDIINTILRQSDLSSVSQLGNLTNVISEYSPSLDEELSVRSKVANYLGSLNDAAADVTSCDNSADQASYIDTEASASAQRPNASSTRLDSANHPLFSQLPYSKPVSLTSSNFIETQPLVSSVSLINPHQLATCNSEVRPTAHVNVHFPASSHNPPCPSSNFNVSSQSQRLAYSIVDRPSLAHNIPYINHVPVPNCDYQKVSVPSATEPTRVHSISNVKPVSDQSYHYQKMSQSNASQPAHVNKIGTCTGRLGIDQQHKCHV